MIIFYKYEHFVNFALDFLVDVLRKVIHFAYWGLGRSTRFCNPELLCGVFDLILREPNIQFIFLNQCPTGVWYAPISSDFFVSDHNSWSLVGTTVDF